MWLRVIQYEGIAWGCLSPRRRWGVVLTAKVSYGHGGRGPSSWSAILVTFLYGGRIGGASPLSKKDYVRALWSCVSKAICVLGAGLRGSNSVQ
jgi:hypothetical protein